MNGGVFGGKARRAKYWQERGYTFDPDYMTAWSMDQKVKDIERANYWKKQGYNFDPNYMTVWSMDQKVKDIRRAEHWKRKGYNFDPNQMTAWSMDQAVRAQENPASGIVAPAGSPAAQRAQLLSVYQELLQQHAGNESDQQDEDVFAGSLWDEEPEENTLLQPHVRRPLQTESFLPEYGQSDGTPSIGGVLGRFNPANPLSEYSKPTGRYNPDNPLSEYTSPLGSMNPNNPLSEVTSPLGKYNPDNPLSEVTSPLGRLNPNNPLSDVTSPLGRFNPDNPLGEGIHPYHYMKQMGLDE